jgi:hypothetical protein
MEIGEVLLLAMLTALAFWRRELFLYIAASACAGLLTPNFWDADMAYGLPVGILSVILLFKAFWQIITGNVRY